MVYCINIQFTFSLVYQQGFQHLFITLILLISMYFSLFCPYTYQQLFITCKYKNFISYIGLITQEKYVETPLISLCGFVDNYLWLCFAHFFVNNYGYFHRLLSELSTYFVNFVENFNSIHNS